MSYARVNNSSDSEDDTVSNGPHQPQQANGLLRGPQRSLTELAAMALPRSHAPYSRLNGEDADHDEDQTDSRKKGPAGEQDKNKSAGDDDDDDANEDNDLEINIRFGEGQDLSLRVPRTDTIAIMKEKVRPYHEILLQEGAGEPFLTKVELTHVLDSS